MPGFDGAAGAGSAAAAGATGASYSRLLQQQLQHPHHHHHHHLHHQRSSAHAPYPLPHSGRAQSASPMMTSGARYAGRGRRSGGGGDHSDTDDDSGDEGEAHAPRTPPPPMRRASSRCSVSSTSSSPGQDRVRQLRSEGSMQCLLDSETKGERDVTSENKLVATCGEMMIDDSLSPAAAAMRKRSSSAGAADLAARLPPPSPGASLPMAPVAGRKPVVMHHPRPRSHSVSSVSRPSSPLCRTDGTHVSPTDRNLLVSPGNLRTSQRYAPYERARRSTRLNQQSGDTFASPSAYDQQLLAVQSATASALQQASFQAVRSPPVASGASNSLFVFPPYESPGMSTDYDTLSPSALAHIEADSHHHHHHKPMGGLDFASSSSSSLGVSAAASSAAAMATDGAGESAASTPASATPAPGGSTTFASASVSASSSASSFPSPGAHMAVAAPLSGQRQRLSQHVPFSVGSSPLQSPAHHSLHGQLPRQRRLQHTTARSSAM